MLESIAKGTILGAALLVLAGCLNPPKTNDTVFEPLPIEKYDELLTSGKRVVVLVDVRPQKDYIVEHIPGAINIPLPEVIAGDPRLAEATDIIACDSGWIDPLGTAAAKRMIALRYSGVTDLKGGLEAWKALGRETVKAPTP